jgi:threonine dehydrogenase-like Zn-dependent dehydrogenase
MKALTWHGKKDVRIETVPDPRIEDASDIVVKVTSTAICGSDLHIYDGFVPQMKSGDILGHEFMGEVVEVGADVARLKTGDRVVVPFVIACGRCYFCARHLWSLCDTTNPDAEKLIELQGHAGAGLLGYSHLYGGYAGGQAELVRVPHANFGPIKIESGLRDDQVLFLSDILPTGWMAAENANIQAGDTVAVWGCGPVG